MAIPLLLAYQGTGRIHAVVQEEGLGAMTLDLEGYIGLVEFGEGPMRWAAKDWRHPPDRTARPMAEAPRRAGGSSCRPIGTPNAWWAPTIASTSDQRSRRR